MTTVNMTLRNCS